jgi:hypothetical protein
MGEEGHEVLLQRGVSRMVVARASSWVIPSTMLAERLYLLR